MPSADTTCAAHSQNLQVVLKNAAIGPLPSFRDDFKTNHDWNLGCSLVPRGTFCSRLFGCALQRSVSGGIRPLRQEVATACLLPRHTGRAFHLPPVFARQVCRVPRIEFMSFRRRVGVGDALQNTSQHVGAEIAILPASCSSDCKAIMKRRTMCMIYIPNAFALDGENR